MASYLVACKGKLVYCFLLFIFRGKKNNLETKQKSWPDVTYCFCGSRTKYASVEFSSCNAKCIGNENDQCGGYNKTSYFYNVYMKSSNFFQF